jgi:hypothetical protein
MVEKNAHMNISFNLPLIFLIFILIKKSDKQKEIAKNSAGF